MKSLKSVDPIYVCLVALFLLHGNFTKAQTASQYSFNVNSGIFNSISTSGTMQAAVLINDSSTIINLSPGFTMNGVFYSYAVMDNNGYLSLFTTPPILWSAYFYQWAYTYNYPVLAPFYTDLSTSGVATSAAYSQTIGTEHVFEWKNFSRLSNGDDNLNFQIRLNTANGEIKFVYGSCIQGSGTNNPIVFWKSTGNVWQTNLNFLTQDQFGSPAYCDWSGAVSGYLSPTDYRSMYFNAANPMIKPNTGLTYTWTPQNVVSPVRTFWPVSNITGDGATINWAAPTGATQYNVQYRTAGTACNWTNWSGNPVSTNSATLSGLLQNTSYQVRVQAIDGTNQTAYSHIPLYNGTTGNINQNAYSQTGTFTTLQLPCAGIPNPGATLSDQPLPCPGNQVLFSMQNAAILGTGISFQWYHSAGAIAGATNQTLQYTINAIDTFYCSVSCGALSANSLPLPITLNAVYNCTCNSMALSAANEDIYQLTIAGSSTNPLYAGGNGCALPAPGPGSVLHKYANFKSLGNLASLTQGDIVPFEIRQNECDGPPYLANGIGLWIDYNHNGSFSDAGEAVYIEPTLSACSGNSPAGDKVISATFQIPLTALTGPTALRVICAEGIAGAGLSPCLSYNLGETEDYLIDIQQALPCAGLPNPGNTMAASTLACPGGVVHFSLQNQVSQTGLSYQWYHNTGLIAAATNATYDQLMSTADVIYCAVACSGGTTVLSNPITITMDTYLNCYCQPNSQFGTSGGYYGWISEVNFNTLSNTSAFPATAPFFTVYPPTANTTTALIPGFTYPLAITLNSGFSQAALWIDWNQNGIFDSTEYTHLGVNTSASFPAQFLNSIAIPLAALPGQTKMRIRSQHYGLGLHGTDACTLLEYGESEDYLITILDTLPCAGIPNPGNTLASDSTACYGSTVHFSLQNQTPGSNVAYQWYHDAGPIPGANTAYYSQIMTLADHIFCQVKCGPGAAVMSSSPVFIAMDTSASCTCIPTSQSGTVSGSLGWISQVSFGSISQASSFPVSAPYYTNYTPAAGTTANILAWNAYPLEVTVGSGHTQAAAWFDWDQNGLFDSTEYVFLGSNTTPAAPATFTQLIYPPFYTPAGWVKLRIRTEKDSLVLDANSACTLLTYGETEDYTISVDAIVPCATSAGGYFTINQNLPNAGNNFTSFSDAANQLSCGISSPVILSVAPGSGPYYEQVYMPEVPGASPINTITILGNNEELSYAASSATAPYTLLMDGSDYFHIKDLKITGTGVPYARTCQLTNGADQNTFTHCTFSSVKNLSAPIAINNENPFSSVVSPYTGLSASNNLITGCTFSGGIRGIVLQGGTGNKIMNNEILDAVEFVRLTSENGTQVVGNLMATPTSLVVGGIGCVLNSGCINTRIEKNKMRNFFTSCPSCTGTWFTGVDVTAAGLPGNENIIANNLISDIDKKTGIFIGIRIRQNANYTKVYHNTISFEDSTIGYSSVNSLGTCGIWIDNPVLGVEVKNNLISIGRGGLGGKGCIYIQSLSGVSCNNNCYYMHSTSGINNYVGIALSLGSFPTLSAWQTANFSAWDQQSVSANPGFTNPAIYDYRPLNPVLDNAGSGVGVLTDIEGVVRSSATPDPGCYEFTIHPIDLGATALVSPDSLGCYSVAQAPIVRIKNYGFAPIDFTLNPTIVYCQLSGAASTLLSTTISTGSLSSGATLDITLPGFNMSASGTYLFHPYTDVAGDTNLANNGPLNPIIRTVGPIGGSIASLPAYICSSYTPTLTLSGYYGGNLQWQLSTQGPSGPWSNTGNGTASFTPAAPVTQTTWYRVAVNCNGDTAFSGTYTLNVYDPHILSITPAQRCGYGSLKLTASAEPGAILNWYAHAGDLIPLAVGDTFTTPAINTNTTFYVSAKNGPPQAALNLTKTTTSITSGHGFLFDVNILNPIRLDSISLMAYVPGTIAQVYYRSGTGIGFNNSAAGWTYLGSGTINTFTGILTPIPLNLALVLQPGLYSFAIKTNANIKNEPGTALGHINTADANMQIMDGYMGGGSGFSFITPITEWAGTMHYSTLLCESAKVPVSASINPPPAIQLNLADSTLCPGNASSIGVSSINLAYAYSWASSPSGFNATGPGPFTISPTTTTTYTVFAADSTAGIYGGCGNMAMATVITGASLSGGTLSSSIDTICSAAIPTLTLSGAAGGAIQWQYSTTSASGPWINISNGTTSYTPASPLTQSTHYRVMLSCQSTHVLSNVVSIVVNTPPANILSTTPGSACGVGGTATLQATATAGATPHWYDAATGGVLLDTGNTYTTPVLANTHYYVSALPGIGGTATAQMPPQAWAPFSVVTYGYWFTAPLNMTITGVNVPYVSASPTTQSIAIVRFNGAIPPPNIADPPTNNFTTLFLTQNNPNMNTIPCNVAIAAGEVIGILGDRSGVASLGPPGYGSPTPVLIAGNSVDFNPMSMDALLDFNYPQAITQQNYGNASRIGRIEFEYNLGGCEEIRTPVAATLLPAPPVLVSNTTPLICDGQAAVLSATSTNPGYTYTWFPGYLPGASISVSPANSTTYTVYAVDNSSGTFAACHAQAETVVNVQPAPAPTAITASDTVICQGSSDTLSAVVPIIPPYCSAGSNTNGCTVLGGYYINHVQFAGINNTSACGNTLNYSNHTGIIANVTAGANYPIAVSMAQYFINTAFWVWIDYNHNGVFDNVERSILNSALTATGNIAIPLTALNGPTRMRIRIGYSGPTYSYDLPCGMANYGEVEDYTVVISGGVVSPYTWSPSTYLNTTLGSTVTAVGMNTTTTYTVTVSNEYGCTRTASKTIVVHPTSASNASITIPCGATYLWNGSTYSITGSYTYNALNALGCDSTATLQLVATPCNVNLNLHCYIQAYYNPVQQQMLPVLANQFEPTTAGACDSIDVELRDENTYTLSASARTVLQQDGSANCIFPPTTGNQYIVVRHRNAIETWSGVAVPMGMNVNYDFTDDAAKAYGSNQVQVASSPVRYAFFSGDVSKDAAEGIDLLDLVDVEFDISAFNYGYFNSDLNGDGNVDLLDLISIETNINNFIFSNHP